MNDKILHCNKTELFFEKTKNDNKFIYIEKGTIYVTLSISLSPFFKNKIEKNFYKLRLNNNWGNFLKYNTNNHDDKTLHSIVKKKEFFTFDEEELNEIYKFAYKAEIFRGIVADELTTPIYKFNKDQKNNCNDINFEFINEIGWDIKIRLTKDGLSTIFLEKTLKKNSMLEDFINERWVLISNRITENILDNILNEYEKSRKKIKNVINNCEVKKQFFRQTYLNQIGVLITYIFLEKHDIAKHILKSLDIKISKNSSSNDFLEPPINVKYNTFNSFKKDTKPLRNYMIAYHLRGVKGKSSHSDEYIYLDDHFNCPEDISKCEKYAQKNCFINLFGSSLLSLARNSYREPCLIEEYTQKQRASIAKRDLARNKGQLCFIESETVVICTPENYDLRIAGQKTKLDNYWKSIIRGFSLIIECKTFAQITSRLIYELMWQHKNLNEDKKEISNDDSLKLEGIEDIHNYLNVISSFIARIRLTAESSNISRSTNAREKFEEFEKVIGIPGIVENIEKDYDDISTSVRTSVDNETNKKIVMLTDILVPLTVVIAIGTLILILLEYKHSYVQERQETTIFTINDHCLKNLSPNPPPEILKDLESIKGQTTNDEQQFLTMLKETIGEKKAKEYQKTILTNCTIRNLPFWIDFVLYVSYILLICFVCLSFVRYVIFKWTTLRRFFYRKYSYLSSKLGVQRIKKSN